MCSTPTGSTTWQRGVIDSHAIVQVSSVEQDVSCSASNIQGHYDAVASLVNNPSINDTDRYNLGSHKHLRDVNFHVQPSSQPWTPTLHPHRHLVCLGIRQLHPLCTLLHL